MTLDGTLGGTWSEVDLGVNAPLTKAVSVYGSAFYDHSIDGGQIWSAGGSADPENIIPQLVEHPIALVFRRFLVHQSQK